MAATIFMFGHGGSRNHGCEAIVRSTTSLFNSSLVQLCSFRPDEDCHYGIEASCYIFNPATAKPNYFSVRFWQAYLALHLHKDYTLLDDYQRVNALSLAPKKSLALSIGGDNYCYSGWVDYRSFRRFLARRKHKTVLWGCSVEPGLIDKKMRKDLSRYDLITARESITYEALKPINPNTVLAPDPAFTLKRQPGNYPQGLGNKPYIGINVSPLIQGREATPNITIENYRTLIRHILSTTDRDIALIPHVVWEHNDDRIPLRQLYEEFQDSGRVYLVEDQNCMQLKDIISGCEFFVGARTHATIAAYSTCVPTLVVGYSVKARGIAKDLFGTEEGYVLPVQKLREKEDLSNAFSQLYERKSEIKEHLDGMMPGYIHGIKIAKEAVEKL